jgi:hypothetical protein
VLGPAIQAARLRHRCGRKFELSEVSSHFLSEWVSMSILDSRAALKTPVFKFSRGVQRVCGLDSVEILNCLSRVGFETGCPGWLPYALMGVCAAAGDDRAGRKHRHALKSSLARSLYSFYPHTSVTACLCCGNSKTMVNFQIYLFKTHKRPPSEICAAKNVGERIWMLLKN